MGKKRPQPHRAQSRRDRSPATASSRWIAARAARQPESRGAGKTQQTSRSPRVLFAVGDADYSYTEGKIWRLAHRLRTHTGWEVVGVTNAREVKAVGETLGLPVQHFEIESPGVSVQERLWATDAMIRETADVLIPGSTLPLWKVLAMDDFLASLQLFGAQPVESLTADLVIVPLMGVDNNTKGTAGLYTWLIAQARQQRIPIVALEVSPLGNKHTLCHLPATHYAVKSEWARDFLVREGLALPPQVSVLRWEEAYLLWPGQDEFTEAYLEKEPRAREILHMGPDRFVVLIPHHVAFLWEVRQILAALAQVPGPLSVALRVDPNTIRRQYVEREIALHTYKQELCALPHAVIDEQIGVGLLLQLADLVITPFAGTVTERAALCRKPTIICQAMGTEGWQGECLYWEPQPARIPHLIQAWRERGLLSRTRLATLVGAVLAGSQTTILPPPLASGAVTSDASRQTTSDPFLL